MLARTCRRSRLPADSQVLVRVTDERPAAAEQREGGLLGLSKSGWGLPVRKQMRASLFRIGLILIFGLTSLPAPIQKQTRRRTRLEAMFSAKKASNRSCRCAKVVAGRPGLLPRIGAAWIRPPLSWHQWAAQPCRTAESGCSGGSLLGEFDEGCGSPCRSRSCNSSVFLLLLAGHIEIAS